MDKKSNVVHAPLEFMVKESGSQKDRLLEEVMTHLFSEIVSKDKAGYNFQLSSGTECFVKPFYHPRKNQAGDWQYGFDVKIEGQEAISHLEFSVSCINIVDTEVILLLCQPTIFKTNHTNLYLIA